MEAANMKLEGIHHVSSITGDAQANVDFYAGTLGLRLVKKTVNQDDPTVYHLFYGDDEGSPGLDLTFFEYPGARPRRAGRGMIHRIVLRVGSEEALDFWERRLQGGLRSRGSVEFSDPEGLGLELRVVATSDAPLTASHPEIPAEHAIQGFEEARAGGSGPATLPGRLAATVEPDGMYTTSPLRGTACLEPGRFITSPGLRLTTSRLRGAIASSRPALSRRLSSTATGSSPFTFASLAACCSRLPRWALALPWTRTPRIWASAWCCHRSSRACATSSKPR